MSIFNFFNSNKGLTVNIKVPGSFETTSIELHVQLTLESPSQESIEKMTVRLRADATKRHNSGSKSQYLGEAGLTREITLAPNKPGQLEFTLPVDFSPIDDFDIPPENLAVASPELKAAAAANRTANYKYVVEVVYKTKSGAEQTAQEPVRLVQPNEVRAG